MAQAQLDLQTQLEQASFDHTAQPLSNNSPVPFLDSHDQVHLNTSEPNS